MATFYGTPAVTSLRPQYATSGEFNELKLGVKVGDLGAGVLDTYLQRASSAIDEFMGRDFSPGDAIHESLYSTNSGNGDVRIGRDGTVSIYPNERFPVNSVASIGWVVKSGAGGLWHAPASAAPQSVASGDITVQKDTYGDGYRIKIWQDFSRLRGPRTTVEFNLVYAGGDGTQVHPDYPGWLTQACLFWAAFLMKKRGDGALVLDGSGGAVDQSALGGYMEAAKDLLDWHKKRF